MSVETQPKDTGGQWRPLYARMKQDLVRRILRGDWRPGELMPSENALAQEYGVSVGTARKAIEELAAECLVLRARGRGTTVAKADERGRPFRFYRLHYRDATRVDFATKYLSATNARATAAEARDLAVTRGTAIIRVERVRLHDSTPAIYERFVLREDLFPDGAAIIRNVEPASLYTLMERTYNIIIPTVKERIQVAAADDRDSEVLGVDAGSPLLEVIRHGIALNGEVAEFRRMRAIPDIHYENVIGTPSTAPPPHQQSLS